MPAPKAHLRQIAQFKLDPKKAYTKADVGKDGHIRPDVTPIPKEEEASKVKPTEAVKASAAPLTPKSDKSTKSATTKSSTEVKKVEAVKSPQVQGTGEKVSDENTVEPKENTDSATQNSVGVDVVVKPA